MVEEAPAAPLEETTTEPVAAPVPVPEEEPEPEPVQVATELQPAASHPGQIRFAEDVLRREPDAEQRRRQRRRPRYVETDEGLDEDPYADYEDEF